MKGIHGLLVALFLLNLLLVPAPVMADAAIPGDATITSATLSVYVTEVNSAPVNIHRITSDWSETGVTWANFASGYDPAVFTSFQPVAVGWQSVDVKDLVLTWLNGSNPNYGFLLSQEEQALNFTTYRSSEALSVEQRPKLEICYDQPGSGNTCVTIQRAGSEPIDVVDSTIYSHALDTNAGDSEILNTGFRDNKKKQALIRFYFTVFDIFEPAVSIVKYTNGFEASDPNGADVPQIQPGQPVTWTYLVTNIGNVPVAEVDVVVTDDQPGVTPVFDHEQSGDGNNMFDPNEVWVYQAAGTAVDLIAPPDGVLTYPNGCTLGGAEDPRTVYINQGTVTIPGATDTAPSSYCNPTSNLYKLYLPFVASIARPSVPVITPFRVTVGYEDLPLLTGQNDYDYNDWVVRIQGSVFVDDTNPDLWKRVRMNFEPGGRGAVYTHSFHMNFPANTFSSNGTAVLVINGPDGLPVSTQTFPFVASANNDFTIFDNTGVVFPANFSNTIESSPRVNPQRTAELTIEFDQAIPFDLSNYDFTIPHGTGLFFDPYLRVRNTGDVVRRGDNRMLNVSEADRDYLWPEERIRIDRAYPNLTFVAGTPPTITFPAGWWTNNNNCVIDGIPCQ